MTVNGKRLVRLQLRWVALLGAVYALAVATALIFADPKRLAMWAIEPLRLISDHQLPPAPAAASLVSFRWAVAGERYRQRMNVDPLMTYHVVLGLASAANETDKRVLARATVIAEAMFDAGIPITKRNIAGCTSMQMAMRLNDAALTEFLIAHGGNLDESPNDAARDPMCRWSPRQLRERHRDATGK